MLLYYPENDYITIMQCVLCYKISTYYHIIDMEVHVVIYQSSAMMAWSHL